MTSSVSHDLTAPRRGSTRHLLASAHPLKEHM